MPMPERSPWREALGELLGSSVLVAVVFASGAVRAQLGAGTMAGALLGSIALGLGYGLVLWSFGSLSGAQTNPLVSIVASLLGGQSWRRTLLRIVAQLAGAAGAGVTIAQVLPLTVVRDAAYAGSSSLAQGVAAFGFMLVALGIAHRRDVKVPLALGAFATASFWMTGYATVGNPLLSSAVLLVAKGLIASELFSAMGAAAIGAGLAVVVARFLFPQVREAAGVLLFIPDGARDAPEFTGRPD
jgi:glycerol uptake facilitator-like aquaporin